MRSPLFIFYFLLIYTSIACSQEKLTGTIYNAQDSSAVFGASVYFDGTSVGVASNENGSFTLQKPPEMTAPLVISSLGFETMIISNYNAYTSVLPPVYLKPSEENLETVTIEADPWTRKKKLDIFRKEFIGTSPEAKKCTIKNEAAIKLNYRPSTETLTAFSNEPIIIVNKFLGYQIKYDLRNFEVQFDTGSSGIQFLHFTYYDGTSFFKELKEEPKRKILGHRSSTYKGSVLHFMRSLAVKSLEENGFEIYHERFKVAPYKFFKLMRYADLTRVELLTEKIVILYNHSEQSSMSTEGPFVIDGFGNHSPPQNIIFSGRMSSGRIAHMLPLNYMR
ncbi:carboxypeptidase-like regulatory domain-containing protein [Zunongwangia sp. F363]|uniref:Carboxypeptidase-like regulatory domain-containing protein n=1 Tax=Autumnicola tepida TaxID=3075595 RepID=A0ABU3CE44_9FLAO|nr:carboxypeptidase-like regulatory domain-containing protein [Zunongwangia sp. F363]MDT0644613.1 carboxypeptidase-like regulatory domain-containing protein [Zunongwangia sp. F363]